MKKLFITLTAIFTTVSFASGQTASENLSKQTSDAGKSTGITINKVTSIKLKTLFVENFSAVENSAILPRAVELNNQGIRLTFKKDYLKALESFNQAASLVPRNEQILFNLGTTLLNLKRDAEAVEVFAKTIKIAPANASAYASLGLALNNTGKTSESFFAFRRSLEISPNDPVTLCNYANALHHAGKDTDALAIIQQALKVSDDNFSAAHNIHGTILFNLNRYDEAKTDFELAIKLDPGSADPLNNLGVVYSREGKKKKAIKYFLVAERLAPDWEDVAYNLALNFLETGNREKSNEYLLKLENINPAIAGELKNILLQRYVLNVSKNKNVIH